jgi:hypothetical protein
MKQGEFFGPRPDPKACAKGRNVKRAQGQRRISAYVFCSGPSGAGRTHGLGHLKPSNAPAILTGALPMKGSVGGRGPVLHGGRFARNSRPNARMHP